MERYLCGLFLLFSISACDHHSVPVTDPSPPKKGDSLEQSIWEVEELPFQNLENCRCFTSDSVGPIAITDTAGWKAHVWHNQYSGEYCDSVYNSPPDFSKHAVVALFWSQTQGCDQTVTTSISRIERNPKNIDVLLRARPFLGHCRAIVRPRQIVLIPRRDLPYVFRGEMPR